MTRPHKGWFEDDDEYEHRIDREACERTIELATGSKPVKGWSETDDEYLERIHREANEHVIEDLSDSKPHRGWTEEEGDYAQRIRLEANESIIEDFTGSRPSRGWTEEPHEYARRVSKEAYEAIIERESGEAPSKGWTETDAEYYVRIRHEARELLAGQEDSVDAEPELTGSDYDSSDYDSSDYSSSSSDSSPSKPPSLLGNLIGWAIILGIGYFLWGPRREPNPANVADASGTPAVVSAPGLNLRSGPGSGHSVLTALDRGEAVQVLTEEQIQGGSPWVQVRARGQTGWVNRRHLDGIGTESSPPASSAPAEPRPATVSPRITLQYQERGDAGTVSEVFEALKDQAGWRVGAPERVLPSGDNRPEVYGGVRFFFEEDSALARSVCEAVRNELAQRGYDVTFPLWPMITLQRQGHFRASRGLIEVWVSPLPQPVTGGDPAQMGRCGR